MKFLLTLIWISLVVILHIHGYVIETVTTTTTTTAKNDYSQLCDHCTNNTYPECLTKDFNMTVYCQPFENNACTFGIIEASDGNNTICLLKDNNPVVDNMMDADTVNMIPINGAGEQTMLPRPMALQMSSTEAEEGVVNASQMEKNDGEDNLPPTEVTASEIAEEGATEVDEKETPTEEKEEIENAVVAEEKSETEMPQEKDEETQVTGLASSEKEEPEGVQAEHSSETAAEDKQEDVAETEIGTIAQSEVDPEEATSHTENEQQTDSKEVEPESNAKSNESNNDEAVSAADIAPQQSEVDYQADAPEENAEDKNKIDNKESEEKTNDSDTAVAAEEHDVNVSKEEEKVTEVEASLNTVGVAQTPSVDDSKVLACYGCTSSTDFKCKTKPVKEVACKAVEHNKPGCYTWLRDNVIERGCLSEIDIDDAIACENPDNKSCLSCTENHCNVDPWPQCFTCDSKKLNETICATWNADKDVLLEDLETYCPAYDDICMTSINNNGQTIRGCIPQIIECEEPKAETCMACRTPLCNGEIFPKTRRRCQQCSDNDANCAEARKLHTSLPCATYRKDDGCFFYVNEMGKMQRGCMSDLVEYEHCKTEGVDGKCISCLDADDCNGTPLMIEPTLSCSHCDTREQNSAASASDCAWAQTNASIRPCTKKYLYYLQESCEYIYQPDIEMAIRGCSLDMGACEPSYEWCRACPTNACNTANLVWQYCLQCSSDENSTCATNANGISLKKCAAERQTYAMRGCYSSKSLETNITTRGCISDLTEEGMKYCKENIKLCDLCYEHGCNNRLAPSSANSAKIELFLLSLTFIITCGLFKAFF